MGRRACLAIGVGSITPTGNKAMKFGYLDGAVVAARGIGEWALSSGFGADNVRVVEDESSPVTQAVVQQAVDALFPANAAPVDHLILAFCGHGLTGQQVQQISWLFSDSLNQRYRVLAGEFCEELLRYGVQRLTLLSDACREAPIGLDMLRWEARRGITVEADQRADSPLSDRLAATQDGQLGYMVSEPASALPGKCVFSGVVTDILWGQEPTAFVGSTITTTSLGLCVRARTTERAKAYKLKLNPDCQVDPEPAVLYDQAAPPTPMAQLQPWPPVAYAVPLGPSAEVAHFDLGAASEVTRGPSMDMVTASAPSLTASFGRMLSFAVEASKSLLGAKPEPPAPEPAGSDARLQAAESVRQGLRAARTSDGADLVVTGRLTRLWSAGPVKPIGREGGGAVFTVGPDPAGLPVLIEFEDGGFAPATPYDGLFAVVEREPSGETYMTYGKAKDGSVFNDTVEAIARFAAGELDADDIDRLAVGLRYGKHRDPAMGAVCALLYRAVGDVDSIRRMAYFYEKNGQPAPFDIALLGGMAVSAEPGGGLRVHVPAVKARAGGVALPDFATEATPETSVLVAGRCPWIGLSWDYVGLVRDNALPLVEGLAEHAPQIPRGGFTVLPAKTGKALAKLWGLKAQWSRG